MSDSVLEGASLIAGIGAIVGTYVKRKNLNPTEKLVAYGTGIALVGFSAYENWKHRQHKKKWMEWMHRHGRHGPHHHHGRHHHGHHRNKHKGFVKQDMVIEGGEELPYDYLERQDQMVMAQDAGQHMWPERQPPGYLTAMGIEQGYLPGSRIYPYPDSIYQSARSRIAHSSVP
jgi:hypothetical protein